ncbi:MAG TPA: RsmE family RNA methyltransferase [Candidatus Saccharimonadales bacterium]|nr:RsmE family RNA methyltransferase [Candidatus Saccharimonadales bacterium]
MTRRRWIADECSGDRAALLGQNAAHLARVLRARVGQEYDLACGEVVRVGTISSVSDERVEFDLGEAVAGTEEREIVLLMAIYKFDRLEWAIEKCTELGVTRILPIIARRTDSHLAIAAAKRVERWRRIAHEAAQQSRRLRPPTIDDAVKLKLALPFEAPTRLLLNENERSKNMRDALAEGSMPIVFAVGPEGGWAEEELAQFSDTGWQSVTLGTTILRAETAAVAALAAVTALLD